jgi:site-specific DNA-methyltransferase (adenine-specific)
MKSAKLSILQGDNLQILKKLPSASYPLIYIDPPFNTGKPQKRTRIKTVQDESGDRIGFQGKRYRTEVTGSSGYADTFDDYLAFLEPRFHEAHRLLTKTGSFFVHLDYREVHYAKVLLDTIFGRDSFINEIIWSYDYGARATKRWSPKHDTILWYAKDPKRYCFNFEAIDRIPYMAPGLVGPEKAARGKTPTDSWWHTIVSPNGKEKTGYPTQKPLGILRRIVAVHSNPGDTVLDFFAGSGSFGAAAMQLGRSATLIDESAEAIRVMKERFAKRPSPTER